MSTRISRRTVATGAAWSVPVLAVSAAAPALAASVTCPTAARVSVTATGQGNAKTWTVVTQVSGLVIGMEYKLDLTVTDSFGPATGSTTFTAGSVSQQVSVVASPRHDNGNATVSSVTYTLTFGATVCAGAI